MGVDEPPDRSRRESFMGISVAGQCLVRPSRCAWWTRLGPTHRTTNCKPRIDASMNTHGENRTSRHRVETRQLPTGVPALDEILGGGLPEYSFNILAGAPG